MRVCVYYCTVVVCECVVGKGKGKGKWEVSEGERERVCLWCVRVCRGEVCVWPRVERAGRGMVR